MRRNLLFTALFFLMMAALAAMPAPAFGAAVFTIGSNSCSINGSDRGMDVAPYIAHGRTYLPVRYVAEAAGVEPGSIIWNAAARQVAITLNGREIMMTAGSKTLVLNGIASRMDAAPEIANGRLMLPVRFLAQGLGLDITWNPASRTVIIDSSKTSPVRDESVTIVDPLQYDSSVRTTGRDFTWQYSGRAFSWHVDVPQELLDWDRQVNRLTSDYYNGSSYSQAELLMTMPDKFRRLVIADSTIAGGDLSPWVNDDDNSQWAGFLADHLARCARDLGYDDWHTAEFIQSFVGGAIPYLLTDVPELPAQTMIDNGDCKDKSILLAAILKNLSYKVALLEFSPSSGDMGHMAVGVAFDDDQVPQVRELSYYLHNGQKFYFAETTSPDWSLGASSVKQPASVYDVD